MPGALGRDDDIAVRSRLAGRRRGVAIVAIGVLLLSPDGVFVRLLTVDDATVIFYRGIAAVGYLVLLYLERGRITGRGLWRLGRAGLAVSCLSAAGNTCFVVSIRATTAAHAMLILAAAPIFTAVFSRAFTHEPVARRTWFATAFVLVGVAGIFLAHPEPGQLKGDLVALAGSVILAALFVVIRRNPEIPMLPSLAVGAVLTSVAAAPFASPGTLTAPDVAIVASFGLVLLPASLALVTRGPRYLPAPQVSLLMLIETVLGPVWVWAALDERPSPAVLLSGLVILAALASHALAGADP